MNPNGLMSDNNQYDPDSTWRILWQTPDYLAVYKPAGLAVQSKKIGEPDLEHLILRYLAENTSEKRDRAADAGRKTNKPDKADAEAVVRGITGSGRVPYLAVINRLDQPVEGIVLFALNAKAAANLSKQLQDGTMRKDYLAVVRKAAPRNREAAAEYFRLTDWLLKDGRANTSRVVQAGAPGAKKAELEYRILREENGFALLDIHLLTGRHHQIRVQLSHAGMPIAGDRKYGGEQAGTAEMRFPALCAYRLTFRDPSGRAECVLSLDETDTRIAFLSGSLLHAKPENRLSEQLQIDLQSRRQ